MDYTRKRNKVLIVLSTILIVWMVAGYPPVYFAKEIKGQIVDASSGRPIKGAVIVAQWISFVAGPGHGGHNLRLHIIETVTDSVGRYTIPSWGPKLHLPFTELDRIDPRLSIFKSGYLPKELINSQDRSKMIRSSDWDGRIIRLQCFNGKIEDYARKMESMSNGLPRDGDEWKSFPYMVIALSKEHARLQSIGLKPGYLVSVVAEDNLTDTDKFYLERFKTRKGAE